MSVSGNALWTRRRRRWRGSTGMPLSFGPDVEAYVTRALGRGERVVRDRARVVNAGTASASGYFVRFRPAGSGRSCGWMRGRRRRWRRGRRWRWRRATRWGSGLSARCDGAAVDERRRLAAGDELRHELGQHEVHGCRARRDRVQDQHPRRLRRRNDLERSRGSVALARSDFQDRWLHLFPQVGQCFRRLGPFRMTVAASFESPSIT